MKPDLHCHRKTAMASRPVYAFLVVLTALVFAGTLVINAAAAGAFGKTPLFHNKTGDVSKYYYLEITPAGWTFSIWSVIYLWQLAWIIYSLTTLCRTTALIPAPVFVLFILNCLLNASWLVLWDRLLPLYGLAVLVLASFSLYGIEYFSCNKQSQDSARGRQENTVDVWLTRILLQNGISFYAGWGTLAMLLNLGIVLTYTAGLNQSISSTIVLASLLVVTLVWFFVEVTQLDRYLRYVFACYIPLIFGLVGSIAKNWDPRANNSILTACILSVVSALTVARVIVAIVRACRQPKGGAYNLFQPSGSDFGPSEKKYDGAPVL